MPVSSVVLSFFQAYDCAEVWPEPSVLWRRSYTFFLLTITYLLPLVILTLTYGSVSRKLWQRTAPGNADQVRDSQQLRSKRKVRKACTRLRAKNKEDVT